MKEETINRAITGQNGPPVAHQFKPGKSGNPLGRPVGAKSRQTIFRQWLDLEIEFTSPFTKERFHGPLENAIVLAVIREALKGNVRAAEFIFDCAYGKQTQRHEVKAETESKVQYTLPDGTVLEL